MNVQLDTSDILPGISLTAPVIIENSGKGKYKIFLGTSQDPSKDFFLVKIVKKSKLFNQFFFGRTFILEETADKIIHLYTNSVLSSLEVDRATLKEKVLAGKEELKSYLSLRIFMLQTEKMPKNVRNLYRRIFMQFDLKDGHLMNKEDNTCTGLTPLDIPWAIERAFKGQRIFPRKIKGFYKFWVNESGEPISIVSRIGDGSFCKAYLYIDLITERLGVFKAAIPFGNDISRPIADLTNEFNLLQYVHESGKVWGIQAKPKEMVTLKVMSHHLHEGKFKEKTGYFGPKYDYSYWLETNVNADAPIEEILLDFHQLLGGLKSLCDLGIIHGDIKNLNILVKKIGDKKWVHHADFGGALRTNQELPLDAFIAGGAFRAASADNFLQSDFNRSKQCALYGNKEELIEMEKGRDVFGLGCVFYYRLSGFHPVLTLPTNENIRMFQGLDARGKLPELKELVESMVNQNFMKRPSAAAAFNQLEAIIQQKFPALADKIAKLIEENGFRTP